MASLYKLLADLCCGDETMTEIVRFTQSSKRDKRHLFLPCYTCRGLNDLFTAKQTKQTEKVNVCDMTGSTLRPLVPLV